MIIIDCNRQRDGFCMALNPRFKNRAKEFSPRSIFIGYESERASPNDLIWKTLCKGLLNFKRMVPCVVKNPNTGKVYFRYKGKV